MFISRLPGKKASISQPRELCSSEVGTLSALDCVNIMFRIKPAREAFSGKCVLASFVFCLSFFHPLKVTGELEIESLG